LMNKREALNQKMYYMAPRLPLTMLVSRLMQKGPCKRYLSAEACTTTGPPTREQFQFLLGPPLHVTSAGMPCRLLAAFPFKTASSYVAFSKGIQSLCLAITSNC
jgi:hypothetical protein